MANLLLKRIASKPTYTIGKLYLDGVYMCDTLEDTNRGLTQKMTAEEIKAKKVKSKTCIPFGIYKVTLDVISSKYSNFNKYPYVKFCKGKMPRLLNVPGFDGILIHAGNTDKDTEGCILVGKNKVVGKVLESQVTWRKLYDALTKKKNEGITITITK